MAIFCLITCIISQKLYFAGSQNQTYKLMKKNLSVAVVALFASALLFSCKKDYTCTCTVTPTGGTATKLTVDFKKVKKKDAEDGCKKAEDTYKLTGAASCSL
jgi:hypothetical protein